MNQKREEVREGHLKHLLLLVPFAAGAGVGALVNRCLVSQQVLGRFWPGAQVSAWAAPSQAAVDAWSIGGAVALWLAAAFVTRRGAPLLKALERAAVAFLPALTILILAALDAYEIIPGVMAFAIHAAIFGAAGFVAVIAFLLASRKEYPLSGTVDFVERRAGWLVALFVALYAATFAMLGILQYNALQISYTDTADWEQMLWNTLHGRFLMASCFPHMFLGEHVEFIQLIFLPFYMILPSLKTLMALKSLALASGAIPVYLLARKRLESRVAGVCFAAAYLLYPAMQYTDLELAPNTFRPEVLAIPAFLWAVYFLDAGRMVWLCVAVFMALSCKEEMAIPVAMIGVLLLTKRRWRWGAAFFVVGVAWFLASILWIIPHFRGGPSHMFQYYLDFGEHPTFFGIAAQAAGHPMQTLAIIFKPVKVDYLLLLFVPLGLMTLLSWRMLVVLIPSLLTALLASREPSFTIYYHYQAAFVPFLVMGAVYGAETASAWIVRWKGIYQGQGHNVRLRAAVAGCAAFVLFSSLLGNILLAKSPISLLFYNDGMQTYWRHLYAPTEHSRIFWSQVRPRVPEGASVAATEFAAAALAAREDDFVLPEGVGKADYLVIDTRDPWLADALSQAGTTLTTILQAPGYSRVYENDGFYVYRREAPGTR